jgi:hypothetical protein
MTKRQLTTKKPPTERIIKDIRTLRNNGKSDEEIRALLGIELRTTNAILRPFMKKIRMSGFPLPRNK